MTEKRAWITSRVEGLDERHEIIHRRDVDAQKLVESIDAMKAREHRGGSPQVSINSFDRGKKNILLAVRTMPDANRAKECFSSLRKASEMGAAVVETPVAFVTTDNGRVKIRRIVTLAKRFDCKLDEQLKANLTPTVRRETLKRAVEKLAILNAAGLIHGHAKPDNFVVRKNDVSLLDYTQMKFSPQATSSQRGGPDLKYFLSCAGGPDEMQNEARRHYRATFKKYSQRFGPKLREEFRAIRASRKLQ